jgi:hypothetical protein
VGKKGFWGRGDGGGEWAKRVSDAASDGRCEIYGPKAMAFREAVHPACPLEYLVPYASSLFLGSLD